MICARSFCERCLHAPDPGQADALRAADQRQDEDDVVVRPLEPVVAGLRGEDNAEHKARDAGPRRRQPRNRRPTCTPIWLFRLCATRPADYAQEQTPKAENRTLSSETKIAWGVLRNGGRSAPDIDSVTAVLRASAIENAESMPRKISMRKKNLRIDPVTDVL